MAELFRSFDLRGPVDESRLQMFCFPFAGGYSVAYKPLHAHIQRDCQMLALEPPGHGTNPSPLEYRLERLVELYEEALLPRLDRPFILFGHSMGGMIAYRLAQKLEQRQRYPVAVFISAVQPPHVKRKVVSSLPDEEFLQYIIDRGGIPEQLVANREVLDYFMPSFRADYEVLETFESGDTTKLVSPVYIVNGVDDEPCKSDATGWQDYAERIEFRMVHGGHMFLINEPLALASVLQEILPSLQYR